MSAFSDRTELSTSLFSASADSNEIGEGIAAAAVVKAVVAGASELEKEKSSGLGVGLYKGWWWYGKRAEDVAGNPEALLP